MRQRTENTIKFNKPAFMCFMNLTQAFDRVRLVDKIALLKKRDVQCKFELTGKKLQHRNLSSQNIIPRNIEKKNEKI